MGSAQNMARLRHHRCNLLLRNTPVGRGHRGTVGKITARLGAALIESTVGCHLVAALVCASAAFGFANYWDRSLPFEFLAPYATPGTVQAGGTTTITFRLGEVRRLCPGDFTSYFIDGAGERFPLGTFPTIYEAMLALDPGAKAYRKDKKIPEGAAKGLPGIYETWPRYWCNLAQHLDPIKAPPLRVPINVAH